MTLEHLYAYSVLPISFQRKTLDTYKQRAARQNKARRKRLLNLEENEDDVGLKGMIKCVAVHWLHAWLLHFLVYSASNIKRPCKNKAGGNKQVDDFEDKENRGIIANY